MKRKKKVLTIIVSILLLIIIAVFVMDSPYIHGGPIRPIKYLYSQGEILFIMTKEGSYSDYSIPGNTAHIWCVNTPDKDFEIVEYVSHSSAVGVEQSVHMYNSIDNPEVFEEIRYKNPEGSLFNFEWHKIGK